MGARSESCWVRENAARAPKPTFVTANREQDQIDWAFAQLRRAPRFNDLLFGNFRMPMRICRQGVARPLWVRTATNQISELIELRGDLAARQFAGTLARIHFSKQPAVNFRCRAGEGRKSDGAMPVLERKLHGHAQRITVLRAVTIAAEPARIGFFKSGNELTRAERVISIGLSHPPCSVAAKRADWSRRKRARIQAPVYWERTWIPHRIARDWDRRPFRARH